HYYFFFSSRRRHTRFSRDWSSDVCSSDLTTQGKDQIRSLAAGPTEPGLQIGLDTLTPQMRLGSKLVHLQVAERLRVKPLPGKLQHLQLGIGAQLIFPAEPAVEVQQAGRFVCHVQLQLNATELAGGELSTQLQIHITAVALQPAARGHPDALVQITL